MITTKTICEQILKLIDKASDNQLETVLEVLQPSSRYTDKGLNSFYNRVQLFEEIGSKGVFFKRISRAC